MIRINLLPPEIIEHRRAESRWLYVIAGALGVAAVIGVFWVIMFARVEAVRSELSSKEQDAANLEVQANRFKIFEDRQNDLSTRQDLANKALAGRVEWARLLSELSLVLPTEVWLQQAQGDELAGLTINGFAVDNTDATPYTGHKAIAKALVRLTDLEQLTNVWLTSSEKTAFFEQPALHFLVTARVATNTVGAASGTPPAQAPSAPTAPTQQATAPAGQ